MSRIISFAVLASATLLITACSEGASEPSFVSEAMASPASPAGYSFSSVSPTAVEDTVKDYD